MKDTEAAILLLHAYWADEVESMNELDAFHWINEEALLDSGPLKEIKRRVWSAKTENEKPSEAQNGPPQQDCATLEEMAAYQRMQDKIDLWLDQQRALAQSSIPNGISSCALSSGDIFEPKTDGRHAPPVSSTEKGE